MRHAFILTVFLLALAGPAQPAAAGPQPHRAVLSEEQAGKFVESLPGMLDIRDRHMANMSGLETGDDPVRPFEKLPRDAVAMRAEIDSHLRNHGFSGLGEWIAVGRPLLAAYWNLDAPSRNSALAMQLAPLALSVRGNTAPTEREVANMANDLYAGMALRNRARSVPENATLARKYESRLAVLLKRLTTEKTK